uniref:Protein GVQW3-like n=1 Tax=Diabrotica virgifera virgifera TaxID=50390 RepID=A0A6P7G1Y0_DIAVI
MQKRNLEQRVAMKFCAKLGETASETYAKIVKVHGDSALSRAQVFRWHKEFQEGRESVEDEGRSGRPIEVRTDAIEMRTKSVVKGTHFESITDIQAAVTRVLADIPVEAFQKCYEAWKTRWNRCIAAQGDYFEGDGRVVE